MANKNPSPETRFGGPRANPGGVTSLQRELEIRNAETATKIRARLLEELHAMLEKEGVTKATLEKVNILGLLRDSEDRGLGTPKASVDVTTNGKDMPGSIDLSGLPSETLEQLIAARDAASKP